MGSGAGVAMPGSGGGCATVASGACAVAAAALSPSCRSGAVRSCAPVRCAVARCVPTRDGFAVDAAGDTPAAVADACGAAAPPDAEMPGAALASNVASRPCSPTRKPGVPADRVAGSAVAPGLGVAVGVVAAASDCMMFRRKMAGRTCQAYGGAKRPTVPDMAKRKERASRLAQAEACARRPAAPCGRHAARTAGKILPGGRIRRASRPAPPADSAARVLVPRWHASCCPGDKPRHKEFAMSLFGAMSTAISGLTSQSAAFSNISDDVANSQTVGFKRVDTRIT
jgi:hypothetical protein